jgi:hypothetical protein
MYATLTGRPPFTGKSTLDIIQKHKFGQFDSPRRIVPDIPHWLDSVVCQCMAKDPKDRFPDAYVLLLRLQEIPKKVEIAASGTIDIDGAAGNDETAPAVGPIDPGAIGGTLMRDLIRAEVDKQTAKSPVEKAFDNTWVLVAMLTALIAATIWWWNSAHPAPEKLFARGEELMAEPPGAAWEEARSDYFEPLLKDDRATWEPRVDPYMRQIAVYDFKREFLGRRGLKSRNAETEVDRFLAKALHYRQIGDNRKARQTLQSLHAVLKGDEKSQAMSLLIESLLEEIESSAPTENDDLLIRSRTRIAELQNAGKTEEAARLTADLRQLYQDDPEILRQLEPRDGEK